MYYYIFEGPRSTKMRNRYEKIRNYIIEYGIGGEIAVASPARSAEELTQMGLERGYTTFVAVGSDSEINKVLTVIQNSEHFRDIAFGAIPINPNSILFTLIKCADVREACEALKHRRIVTTDLAFIEPNRYFLSPARLDIGGPTKVELVSDLWQIDSYIEELVVHPDMTIEFVTSGKRSCLQKLTNWLLGKKPANISRSIFRPRTILITAPQTLSLSIGSNMIAKTPLTIYRKPKVLRLIVKRDKIATEPVLEETR